MFVSVLPDPTCNSEKSANGGNKQILLLLLLLLLLLTIVRKTTKKAKVTVKLVIQKSEPICENSPVTQMDVAVALLRWSSKYSGVSEAAVSDL